MIPISRLAVALLACVLIGCASTGLSPRERPGQDVSSYLYASEMGLAIDPTDAADPQADDSVQPPRVVVPASVTVAQIGEVAPPSAMLEALEAKGELFSRVNGISGMLTDAGVDSYGRALRPSREMVRDHATKLRQLARSLGSDYLLIYGGTVDATDRGTPLSVLDATIIGAFVVPSRVLEAEGKATAILIDTRSGRVVATATADGNRSGLSPAFGREGAQERQMRRLRDEVISELTGEIIERFEGLDPHGR